MGDHARHLAYARELLEVHPTLDGDAVMVPIGCLRAMAAEAIAARNADPRRQSRPANTVTVRIALICDDERVTNCYDVDDDEVVTASPGERVTICTTYAYLIVPDVAAEVIGEVADE